MQGYLLFTHPTPAFGLPGWEGLAKALAAAQAGDASAFGSYRAQSEADPNYAGLAIECVDWETDIATYDDSRPTKRSPASSRRTRKARRRPGRS